MNTAAAIVNELGHLPAGYLQNRRALSASLRLAIAPTPAEAEIDAALNRLEADRLIVCHADPLTGKGYALTDYGRAKYTELFT